MSILQLQDAATPRYTLIISNLNKNLQCIKSRKCNLGISARERFLRKLSSQRIKAHLCSNYQQS